MVNFLSVFTLTAISDVLYINLEVLLGILLRKTMLQPICELRCTSPPPIVLLMFHQQYIFFFTAAHFSLPQHKSSNFIQLGDPFSLQNSPS